jgi:hypothetical protein
VGTSVTLALAGEVFKLERSMIVEIDGQKSDHWNRIKYYTVEDM